MSVQNINEFKKTLDTYNIKDWVENDGLVNHEQSFEKLLTQSLNKVNELQQEANKAIERLSSGESKNIHETMLAVEKAEIAFKTMNQIRSRVIGAYKEIMRIQV